MRNYLFLMLLLALPAYGQDRAEEEFAKLPADIQSLLRHLPADEALRKVAYARQNLIATGNTYISAERLRTVVEIVLAPNYAAARSASAGATSFPPLSPLVPAISFEAR
jgi:hypothetical protein